MFSARTGSMGFIWPSERTVSILRCGSRHMILWNQIQCLMVTLAICGAEPAGVQASAQVATHATLGIENGWFVHNGRVVWGYAQHNAWWKPSEGANRTRRLPGTLGPKRTEDLEKLTDAMLRYGYPTKGLIHHINASRQQIWAFLMGGGSMLFRFLPYPEAASPTDYLAPEATPIVQTTYDFINRHLSDRLPKMAPLDLVQNRPDHNACLGEAGKMYLVYALAGGAVTLDLSNAPGIFRAKWFDPRTGSLHLDAAQETVRGGKVLTFTAPGTEDWILWLTVTTTAQGERK